MKYKKSIIIASALLALTLACGLVINFTDIQNIFKHGSDTGTASASAINSYSPNSRNGEDNKKDYTYIPPTPEYHNNNGLENEGTEMSNNESDAGTSFIPAEEIDLDPSSITVLVNKEHALPKDYVPEDLVEPNVLFDIKYYDDRKLMRTEAAKALEELFAAAKKDGCTLYGVSGYRSYDRQKKIFTNNILTKGKNHTLKYSAVPGTSEHQTGLAIDVSIKSINYKLTSQFAASSEGIWLSENAHYFGYIIRYPKEKEEITGYSYEPWHIRYVGKDLATYLYLNNLTLDEYYNYTPGENFDFEALYAEFINIKPPKEPEIPEEGEEDGLLEEDELDDVAFIDEEADDENSDSAGDLPEDEQSDDTDTGEPEEDIDDADLSEDTDDTDALPEDSGNTGEQSNEEQPEEDTVSGDELNEEDNGQNEEETPEETINFNNSDTEDTSGSETNSSEKEANNTSLNQ